MKNNNGNNLISFDSQGFSNGGVCPVRKPSCYFNPSIIRQHSMNIYPVRNKTQPLFCGADYRYEQFTRKPNDPGGISNGIYSNFYLNQPRPAKRGAEEAF